MLSSLAAINDFRAASPENFSHRIGPRVLFPGIVFKGTSEYQLPRRLVLTYLKRLGMGKLGLEAQIQEETDMFMEYLEGEVVVDADTTLAMFTSNNIMQMMIGQRCQYGDSSAVNAIHSIHANSALLLLRDWVPLFRYLPNVARAYKKGKEALGFIRNLFRQMIEKQIAERDSVESDDFTGAYLQEHEAMDEKEINNLVDLCHYMFIAGTYP